MTDYKPEFVEQGKRLASVLGATDAEIAQFFGVTDRTIRRWKLAHMDFAKALKVGKEPANERVKRSLYLRAVGYSHPAEKVFCTNGAVTKVQTIEHYPPDTTAAIFFLCNRDPENWRQRNTTEHTGPNGGPIQSISTTTTDPIEAARIYQQVMSGGK